MKSAITIDVKDKELFHLVLAGKTKEVLGTIQTSYNQLHNIERDIIGKAWPDYNGLWHVVSYEWDCPKSPFGYCAYDHFEDPVHDSCLFCGDPQERK